jgi:sugar lactone lactonase YvrE
MEPRDVAVEANGDIVVADTRADRVQVLRADGAIDSWARVSPTLHRPVSGGGNREFRDPNAVAIDPRNGDVYVAEGGNHRIQRISQAGTWLATWGGTAAGKQVGRFTEPLGVAVAPDGTVWVADTRNDRLQRLDPVTGVWTELTGFSRPTAVAVLPDGRLAVTELGADPMADPAAVVGVGRLIVLDADGTRVATREGLDRPEGVAVDPDGGVLVAETQADRILRFRLAEGALVDAGQIGEPGLRTGHFTRPMGMDATPSGDLVIADTYSNRLQRFVARRGRTGD